MSSLLTICSPRGKLKTAKTGGYLQNFSRV
jgi:hypothetical protein